MSAATLSPCVGATSTSRSRPSSHGPCAAFWPPKTHTSHANQRNTQTTSQRDTRHTRVKETHKLQVRETHVTHKSKKHPFKETHVTHKSKRHTPQVKETKVTHKSKTHTHHKSKRHTSTIEARERDAFPPELARPLCGKCSAVIQTSIIILGRGVRTPRPAAQCRRTRVPHGGGRRCRRSGEGGRRCVYFQRLILDYYNSILLDY